MRVDRIDMSPTSISPKASSATSRYFQFVSPAQVRAARALINISQRQLAEMSHVAIATIKRVEVSEGISGRAATIAAIVTALEQAGIRFVPEDEMGGVGVRLVSQSREQD